MNRTMLWAAAAAIGSVVVSGLSATRAMPIPKGPAVLAWPGPDPAIYLGCGGVGGPGTVIQLDLSGKVLGKIELAETPYGLTADRAGLVAALPGANLGRVVRIDRTGKVETLLKDAAGFEPTTS